MHFCPHTLLAGAEFWHSVPQFVQREKFFLVGRDQPLHTLADAREFPLEGFLPPLRRFGGARRVKAPVEFGTDEIWISDEADDLLPHDLVKQVLADWPTVADGATEMAPGI